MGMLNLFRKKEVTGCWFSLHEDMLDTLIQRFGKLCYELAKVVPEGTGENVIIRVTVDRDAVAVKLSIDTFAVDLLKVIPGIRLAEMYGWEMNSRYLEGVAQRIDLPDVWSARNMTDNIIHEFRKGFPNAGVINKSNDYSTIEWVVFHAVVS